jgi:diaminobutyrate-2-oxoglutarate transaminase
MTLGSLACTSNGFFRQAAGVPLNYVQRQPFGCETPCRGCTLGCGVDAVERLRAQYADPSGGLEPPAAFIVEAVQAEGGVHVASAEWLKATQQLARDLGALFIIDDIQAGCGRTGSYFSFDGMGLDPDIVNLAKGIGGFGTPLAMNLVKPEHDAHWSPGEHTGTFRGQGFSFVAGVEALKYFDDDALMNDVRKKGERMRARLQSICDAHDNRSFQVRGKGMMQGLDVVDGSLARQAVANCFERGLILGACGGGGNVLKLIPPLTIPDADLEEGLDMFEASVEAALEAA